MKTTIFGYTQTELPIWAYEHGNDSKPEVLVIGGVHGNEPEGVVAAQGLLRLLFIDPLQNIKLTIVPELNKDGVLLKTRKNARGVDLNRNLPTQDWTPVASQEKYHPGPTPLSESENKALVSFIEKKPLRFILSLHSFTDYMLLDNKGLAAPQCEFLSKVTGYKIKNEIGYPTPGSLGTYAAIERNIPTLTYELQRDMPFQDIQKVHTPAIYNMLKTQF